MYVQVTADRAGGRSQGVGSTKEDTALLDHVLTLPDHGNNGARGHVLDQTREEGLALEVGVVLGKPKENVPSRGGPDQRARASWPQAGSHGSRSAR